MKKNKSLILVLASAALFLAGCGGLFPTNSVSDSQHPVSSSLTSSSSSSVSALVSSEESQTSADDSSSSRVIAVTGITLNETSVSIEKDATYQLVATVSPENATDKNVTWKSDNPDVATVDDNGLVTGKKPGSAKITAKAGVKEATCSIDVSGSITKEEFLDAYAGFFDEMLSGLKFASISKHSENMQYDDVTIYKDGYIQDVQVISNDEQINYGRYTDDGTILFWNKSNGKAQNKGDPYKVSETKEDGTAKTADEIKNETFSDVAQESGIYAAQMRYAVSIFDFTYRYSNGNYILKYKAPDGEQAGMPSMNCILGVEDGKIISIEIQYSDYNEGLKQDYVYGSRDEAPDEMKDDYYYLTEYVDVTGISLDRKNCSITEGETVQLTADVSPENATDKNVTWRSDNPDVAAVDENGLVTAVSSGSAVITATAGWYEAKCEVEVLKKAVPATGVTLDQKQVSLQMDIVTSHGDKETVKLTAAAFPEDTTDAIIWKSDDPTVATVDDEGLVTAVGGGITKITCTAGEFSDTCDVIIQGPISSAAYSKALDDVLKKAENVSDIWEFDSSTMQTTTPYENAITDNTNIFVYKEGYVVNKTDPSDIVYARYAGDGTYRRWKNNNGNVNKIESGKTDISSRALLKAANTIDPFSIVDVSGYQFSFNIISEEQHVYCYSAVKGALDGDASLTEAYDFFPGADGSLTLSYVKERIYIRGDKAGSVEIIEQKSDVFTSAEKKDAPSEVKADYENYVDLLGIELDKKEARLHRNDNIKLNYSFNPENPSEKPEKVTWQSSNPSVASVDQDGNVTALKEGTAVITVSTSNFGQTFSVQCEVNVVEYEIKYELNGGTNAESNPTGYVIDSGTINLADPVREHYNFDGWYLDGEKVDSIDSSLAKDITLEARWTEIPLTGIRLSYDKNLLKIGEEEKVSLEFLPEGVIEHPVIWKSSDESVATVKDGVVHAEKTGRVTITAVCEEFTEEITFYVNETNISFTYDEEKGTAELSDVESTNFSEFVIPTEVINNGKVYRVSSIGDRAFSNCTSLKTINIPDSIESIKSFAFVNCSSLSSVTIPESVTDFGTRIFGCDSLSYLETPYTWDESFDCIFNRNVPSSLKKIVITKCISIPHGAFANFYNVESIVIPSTVTSIGGSAFYRCTSLSSFDIPGSVTDIGSYAFIDCVSLTSISIPKGVKEIKSGTFKGCTLLNQVYIPDSVCAIGEEAFFNCYDLVTITIPESVTEIGKKAFGYCWHLKEVVYHATDGKISVGNQSDYSESDYLNDKHGGIGFYALSVKYSGESEIKETENGYQFLVGDDGVTYLINYRGKDKDLILPESFNGNDYTIASYAFYRNKDDGYNKPDFNSVTISSSVVDIEDYAFYCCKPTFVILPSSIRYIGFGAFFCHSISKVYYGGSYDKWNNITFKINYYLNTHRNDSLTSATRYYFTLKGDGEAEKGSWWYYDAEGKIVEKVNEYGLSVLKDDLYLYADDTDGFTLEHDAKNADGSEPVIAWTSSDEKVAAVDKDGKVTPVGVGECTITATSGDYSDICTVHILEKTPFVYEKVYGIKNEKANIKGISDNTVTEITIPMYCAINGMLYRVSGIGTGTFGSCNSLKNVYYDGTMEDWCRISFNDYSSNPMCYASHFFMKNENGEYEEVTSIVIPDGVESIGRDQFHGFKNVTSVIIPSTVKSIGESAFYNCSSLENIYYDGTMEDWCRISFNDYSSNPMCYASHFFMKNEKGEYEEVTSIVIPKGVESIGRDQFYGLKNVTSITIPSTVSRIGGDAFYGCSSLENIYYDGTMEDWCKITFDSSRSNPMCYASHFFMKNGKGEYEEVTSVEIPDGVESIGDYQFLGFMNITSVTIPSSVTSIGYSAFSNCSSLTSVTIPSSVTSIGTYAFSRCSSLTSILIPKSITNIGVDACYNCKSLKKIYYEGSYDDWENIKVEENGNDSLTSATRYYFTSNGDNETSSGNWWYYDAEGKIVEKVVK